VLEGQGASCEEGVKKGNQLTEKSKDIVPAPARKVTGGLVEQGRIIKNFGAEQQPEEGRKLVADEGHESAWRSKKWRKRRLLEKGCARTIDFDQGDRGGAA